MGVLLSEVQPNHHELEIPVTLRPHNTPPISVLPQWTTSKKLKIPKTPFKSHWTLLEKRTEWITMLWVNFELRHGMSLIKVRSGQTGSSKWSCVSSFASSWKYFSLFFPPFPKFSLKKKRRKKKTCTPGWRHFHANFHPGANFSCLSYKNLREISGDMLGKHQKTLNYNFARGVVNLTGQKINQTKASLHSSSS